MAVRLKGAFRRYGSAAQSVVEDHETGVVPSVGDLVVVAAGTMATGCVMGINGFNTRINNGPDAAPTTYLGWGIWTGYHVLTMAADTPYTFAVYIFDTDTVDMSDPLVSAEERRPDANLNVAIPNLDTWGWPGYDAGYYGAWGAVFGAAFYNGGVSVQNGTPPSQYPVGGLFTYNPNNTRLNLQAGGYGPGSVAYPTSFPVFSVSAARRSAAVSFGVHPKTPPRVQDFAVAQSGESIHFWSPNVLENPVSFRFGQVGGHSAVGPDVWLNLPQGAITVYLRASNSQGDGYLEKGITVIGPSLASITATQVGDQVQFGCIPNGSPITRYRWDFGQGDTSSEANPLRAIAAGSYTATLVVSNATGELTYTVPYTVLGPDVTDIHASQTGAVMSFRADIANAHNLTYAWDFGNGQTSALATPALPMAPGTYTITLTVTNRAGSDTYSEQVRVAVEAPIANFRWQRIPGEMSVIFTDTSQRVDTRAWTITKDGVEVATSTEAEWTHTFLAEGTYVVTIVVTNETGTSTKAQTVTLSADWTAHEVAGRVVSLFAKARDGRTADITCDITTITWDYGTQTDESLLTVVEATRLVVRFDDTDGELDPLRGPLREVVKAGSELTYMLGVHGDVKVAMHGLIQDVVHDGSTAILTAYDAIGVLAQADIPTDSPGVRVAESAEARMDGILDLAGWPTGRRSYVGMQGTDHPVAPADLRGQNAWQALVDLALQTGAMLWVTPDGIVTMHDRAAGLVDATTGMVGVKRWRRAHPAQLPADLGSLGWMVASDGAEARQEVVTIGCAPDAEVTDLELATGMTSVVNTLVSEAVGQARTTVVPASVAALGRRDSKQSLPLVTDDTWHALWSAQHAWEMGEPVAYISQAQVRVTPEVTAELLHLEPFDYVRIYVPPQAIDQTLRVIGMSWAMDTEGVYCSMSFMSESYDTPELEMQPPVEAGGQGSIGGDIGSGGGGGGGAAPAIVSEGIRLLRAEPIPSWGPGADTIPFTSTPAQTGDIRYDGGAKDVIVATQGWYTCTATAIVGVDGSGAYRKVGFIVNGSIQHGATLIGNSTSYGREMTTTDTFWLEPGARVSMRVEAIGAPIASLGPCILTVVLVGGPKGDKGDRGEPGPAGPTPGITSGEWTPQLGTSAAFVDGAVGTWGKWRRIGDVVEFWLSYVHDKGPISGDSLYLTLPSEYSEAMAWHAAKVGYAGALLGFTAVDGAYPIMAYTDRVGIRRDSLRLCYFNNGGTTIQMGGQNIGDGSHLIISGSYIVDA